MRDAFAHGYAWGVGGDEVLAAAEAAAPSERVRSTGARAPRVIAGTNQNEASLFMCAGMAANLTEAQVSELLQSLATGLPNRLTSLWSPAVARPP